METPGAPSMISYSHSPLSDNDVPITDAPSMISYTRVTPSLLHADLKWYAHAVAGKLVTNPRVHEFRNESEMFSALQEATRGLTAEELATFLQKIGPALDERKFITQSEIEEERRVQEEEKPSPLDVVMQGFRLPSPSTMAVFMLAPLVFIDLYFRIWEGVKVLKL